MINIRQLKSKLKLLYTIFITPPPKKWQLPNKSEVLIYDACDVEALTPYLIKYSVAALAVHEESINIPWRSPHLRKNGV